MSARLREIARQTVAIAEAGEYRNAAGERVAIGESGDCCGRRYPAFPP
jgi:hypothetical protein